MKHFTYTLHEEQRPKRNGTTYKTVRLYRIVKNVPIFVGETTETFVSEFQLVMTALEEHKCLPSRAFAENPMGGYMFGSRDALLGAGFATVTRIM